MVAEIEILNLSEVQNWLSEIPDESFDAVSEEVTRALASADENIKTKTELKRRTGNLMKSIQIRVQGSDFESLEASIYTTSVYAPTHEYGATIRAKNAYKGVPGGPYLNIPTDANKTPAGVTRMTATQVFAAGGFICKFQSGKYGLMLNGEVVYTFHKQVTIPKRLKMIEYTENEIPTMLSRIADRIGEE